MLSTEAESQFARLVHYIGRISHYFIFEVVHLKRESMSIWDYAHF